MSHETDDDEYDDEASQASQDSENASQKQDDTMDQSEYLHLMNLHIQHSSNVRQHDLERDATMTKFLPMKDRIDLGKEKKVGE